jgi:2,3-diketo-5-methylthio-1-phosphopentane phosphatase
MNNARYIVHGCIVHFLMLPAILIDFDGTIVPYDVEFEIFAQLGGEGKAGDVVARWERGELDVPGRLTTGFSALQQAGVTRQQLEAFLDRVPLEPTFPAFLKFLNAQQWPSAILSDGLVWYIEGILKRYQVQHIPPIISNIIDFENDWQLRFPNRNGDCSPCRQCAACKRYPVRTAKTWSDLVVLVTDGRADRWAAVECDVVFAKEPLLPILQAWGKPARLFEFTDFESVQKTLLEITNNS